MIEKKKDRIEEKEKVCGRKRRKTDNNERERREKRQTERVRNVN